MSEGNKLFEGKERNFETERQKLMAETEVKLVKTLAENLGLLLSSIRNVKSALLLLSGRE